MGLVQRATSMPLNRRRGAGLAASWSGMLRCATKGVHLQCGWSPEQVAGHMAQWEGHEIIAKSYTDRWRAPRTIVGGNAARRRNRPHRRSGRSSSLPSAVGGTPRRRPTAKPPATGRRPDALWQRRPRGARPARAPSRLLIARASPARRQTPSPAPCTARKRGEPSTTAPSSRAIHLHAWASRLLLRYPRALRKEGSRTQRFRARPTWQMSAERFGTYPSLQSHPAQVNQTPAEVFLHLRSRGNDGP